MCVIIAKYFPNTGWVGIKNRDRNYIPTVSFKKVYKNNLEITYFWDNITQYCEGLNSSGIAVLSASLMVHDDEKEIKDRSNTPSKDGIKIKQSLEYSDINQVVNSLIENKLTGHTIVFNKDQLFLIEGMWRPGEYKKSGYEYVVREIPHNRSIVRTNHGIWLDNAGYQRSNTDLSQTESRISSECRKTIGELVVQYANSPIDILNELTKDFTSNSQLNAMRVETKNKKMRTTSQTMIIPFQHTMFVRPIQSNLEIDNSVLSTNHKTLIKLLDYNK